MFIPAPNITMSSNITNGPNDILSILLYDINSQPALYRLPNAKSIPAEPLRL